MKSRARYSLIATGIIAFIVLSPLIVLFVTGLKYDFTAHAFVQTGTLSVQSNPSGAKIYINGNAAGKTARTIRFMTPGDYDVDVKLNGYFTWSKNLNVKASYVTYASDLPKGLTLFYALPAVKNLADNVQDLFVGNKRIAYQANGTFLVADLTDPAQTQQVSLPNNTQMQITASPDENYFVLANSTYVGVLDVRNNELTDITALVDPSSKFQFAENNALYALTNKSLFSVDWNNGAKTLLFKDVSSFFAASDAIYFLESQQKTLGASNNVIRAHLPSLEQKILVSGLPDFFSSQLFLTPNNQMMILGNNTLYSGDETPQKIADSVQFAALDNEFNKLLYATPNEIDSYDFNDGTSNLITRSSHLITNPIAATGLGYVFFQNEGRLQNIEIDPRGHQNNYTFAKTGPTAKFYLDPDQKNIFLLDNGNLSELTIR